MGFGDWLMRGLGFDSKKKEKVAVEEPVAEEAPAEETAE